ncbi:MAG TPA: peptidylprolyl isomerase [Candidatus Competibacteraceae bacterium]|nr:peptidylprolyl isomerase [Candidatus Competibacteraceae bacterium]
MNKLLFPLLLSLPLCTLPIAGQAQLVFGPGTEGTASTLDTIVAVVNDDVITHRELNTAIALVERQMRQNKVQIPPRADLETQVLERLILSQLELRTAERNGITVDDTTLNTAIDNLARRNNMSLTQLRQTVEKDGISFAKFRDDVRRELMVARLRQKAVDSQIQISDQDVESLQTQLAGQINPAGSSGSTEYHIAQILIAVPEGASPEQIATAKRQAENVLAQLGQGGDFGRLAASVSAGQQALEGGDLGWRRVDQLPTLFADAVLKLQPGQVSQLIRSPSGFHIVKLLDVRGSNDPRPEAQTATADIERTRIREALFRRRSDEEWEQWLRRLRDEAYVEIRLQPARSATATP